MHMLTTVLSLHSPQILFNMGAKAKKQLNLKPPIVCIYTSKMYFQLNVNRNKVGKVGHIITAKGHLLLDY